MYLSNHRACRMDGDSNRLKKSGRSPQNENYHDVRCCRDERSVYCRVEKAEAALCNIPWDQSYSAQCRYKNKSSSSCKNKSYSIPISTMKTTCNSLYTQVIPTQYRQLQQTRSPKDVQIHYGNVLHCIISGKYPQPRQHVADQWKSWKWIYDLSKFYNSLNTTTSIK